MAYPRFELGYLHLECFDDARERVRKQPVLETIVHSGSISDHESVGYAAGSL
jgi:hypothetical protein